MLPKVAIAIVISRQKTHPHWVEKAIRSAQEQYYTSTQLILIDNNDNTKTIGQCFNLAVQKCDEDVKWIFFLGDDDYISPDYILSLVSYGEHCISKRSNIVNITSYLTMFKEKKIDEKHHIYLEQTELVGTGMWIVKYLKSNPANEDLRKLVDTEMFKRMKKNGWSQEALYWHYGYFYRIHGNQISGEKQLAGKPHIKRKKSKEEINGNS